MGKPFGLLSTDFKTAIPFSIVNIQKLTRTVLALAQRRSNSSASLVPAANDFKWGLAPISLSEKHEKENCVWNLSSRGVRQRLSKVGGSVDLRVRSTTYECVL